MRATANIRHISTEWLEGEQTVTFQIQEKKAINELKKLEGDTLILDVDTFRNKRSRDANACLWWCIRKLAPAINRDQWSTYLFELKRYGVCSDIKIRADALETFQKMWREYEITGSEVVNGWTYNYVTVYYGSSQYDSAQFKVLLEGVISDLEMLGLETPLPEDVRQALERWGKDAKHYSR